MPGSWLHLAARFFDTAAARPPTPDERERIDGWLMAGPESEAFWEQQVADQRHGLEAAEIVVAAGGRREMIRAALLHDVGKRHSRLGVVGRVLASIALRFHLPVRGRWAVYRDHGAVGAADLASWGAEPLVVAYAGRHHQERPATVAPGDWDLLVRADGARRRRGR